MDQTFYKQLKSLLRGEDVLDLRRKTQKTFEKNILLPNSDISQEQRVLDLSKILNGFCYHEINISQFQ